MPCTCRRVKTETPRGVIHGIAYCDECVKGGKMFVQAMKLLMVTELRENLREFQARLKALPVPKETVN